MSTTTIEQISTEFTLKTNGSPPQRRDLKTSIFHADEELYQKQLEAKGGKEDMWQGGDMSVLPTHLVYLFQLTKPATIQTHPKSPTT